MASGPTSKHCLDMTKDHLVQALHEHFDKDKDGFLNFKEIGALQEATSGDAMTENQYVMVCRTLQCQPGQGISLTALRLTYAAEGTSAEEDYTKVFGKSAKEVKSKEQHTDDIYEVGDGGVDISS
ncbi:expressed unknown protein [Seminavis robusta]|uniref:EF-hand domain-containing protein n=1 Tax=Seminavis robusta TaxID=568900 RepID=A0A9N8H8J0_9STRA|nr:expressed unknown protein [Seminavis robusta]|eukprot:Sro218_g090160.1 n/a (125) ;mRNA; f:65282-65656